MNLGDTVIIKECHKIPDLVGKEAKVVAMVDPSFTDYPIQVLLTEPIAIDTPLGKGETKGPFGFREDELEVHKPPTGDEGIPDVFKGE